MTAVNTSKRSKKTRFIKLKGTVAFPGEASGKALLLGDVSKKIKKEGFILVAEATYPEYLPLMLKSNGIVTEVGGILSHAAIVAREFKITCVVGVKDVTSRIRTGDKVIIKKDGVVLAESR